MEMVMLSCARGQMVAVRWWWRQSRVEGMMVVEKQKALFVYDAHMSFRQMPLTRSPKTQRLAYVKLLANAVPFMF